MEGAVTDRKRSKRRLVLHEDYVGMCHSTTNAFVRLRRLGTCSSGAVMVPMVPGGGRGRRGAGARTNK